MYKSGLICLIFFPQRSRGDFKSEIVSRTSKTTNAEKPLKQKDDLEIIFEAKNPRKMDIGPGHGTKAMRGHQRHQRNEVLEKQSWRLG